jgi:hypothetical protein
MEIRERGREREREGREGKRRREGWREGRWKERRKEKRKELQTQGLCGNSGLKRDLESNIIQCVNQHPSGFPG